MISILVMNCPVVDCVFGRRAGPSDQGMSSAERGRLTDGLLRMGNPVGWLQRYFVASGDPSTGERYGPGLDLKSPETWAKTALLACFVLGLLAVLGYVLWI